MSEEKKLSAVEWLAEKYNYVTWMRNRDEISAGLADEWRKHYLEQAKEMEKQQVIDVSDSSLNSIENAKNFLDNLGGFIYNIFDEDNGLDRTELSKILVQYAESLK